MSFVPANRRHLAVALGLAAPLAYATVARAQPAGGGTVSTTGGGGAPAGAPAGANVTGTTTTVTQGPTTYGSFPGGVAPTPPGQALGGGNVQFSSSRPITGSGDRDTFDFRRGMATSTVRGNAEGSFVIGGGEVQETAPSAPGVHVVRKGDTLWGICGATFENPYQWPRIWSYNPQIQNPHWIYPGDQLRLRGGVDLPGAPAPATAGTPPGARASAPALPTGPGLVDRRRQVPSDTVFLRTAGYIEDDKSTNWGEISGSPEDKMILSDLDEVYLRLGADHDVKIGQELTIYRPVKNVGGGKLIEIQGTARIDQWNPKERTARARIIETLDAIERGARIGPVTRRFEVVPPSRNEVDVEAKILTSIRPHNLYGQNQVIFLDKGEEAGLKPGNRLLILKKGDAWHQSFTNRSAVKRIAMEDDSPAATETVPRPRNEQALPEEIQAELRVIAVKKKTSMAIVSDSRREIELGDKAYARKGY